MLIQVGNVRVLWLQANMVLKKGTVSRAFLLQWYLEIDENTQLLLHIMVN